MEIKIDFAEQGRRLAEKFQERAYVAETKLGEKLLEGAKAIEEDAVRSAPVLTGQLRASIATKQTGSKDDPAFEVGSLVEYANHVEYGTVHQAAKPFLRPAFQANKEFVKQKIAEALREEK